jgi:hypothetical protein
MNPQLRLSCSEFLEEGWELENSEIANPDLPTNCATLLLSPARGASYRIFFFFNIFTREFWEYLRNIINHNLALTREKVVKSEKSRYKPVSVSELIQLYGVIMLLESTSGNDSGNLKQHLGKLDEEYGILLGKKIELNYFSEQSNQQLPTLKKYAQFFDEIINNLFLLEK